MAPEQIRGTPAVSHKTDLYSLGVVLYQMLVGRPPFEGASPVVLMHCHLNEPVPRPSAKVHEIPRALDDLVVGADGQDARRPALGRRGGRGGPDRAAGQGPARRSDRDGLADPGSPGANPPRAGGLPGGAADPSPEEEGPQGHDPLDLDRLVLHHPVPVHGGEADEAQLAAGLETLLLVGALLGIGGLIVYLVWPPGQESLYKHAEALMASDSRSDWINARDEYLEPLDRRFPNHPYREQTTRWRDRILLRDAEGRAGYLTAPVVTAINQPKTDAERQFVITHAVAAEASKRGDDLAAVQQWKELAAKFRPEDKDERQWYLLALHRADQLEAAIRDRRQFVETQLRLAGEAIRAGRPNQAIAIRSKLVEQYAGYTDLADLFPGAALQPGAGSSPPASPGSATASPGQRARSGESAAGLGAGKARDSPRPRPDPSGQHRGRTDRAEARPESKVPADDGAGRRRSRTVAIPSLHRKFTNNLTANSVVNEWTLIDGKFFVR